MSEKISSLDIEGKVGSFNVPTSILFYIQNDDIKERIIHNITDRFQVKIGDEIRIKPDGSKSKKGVITIGAMREFVRSITLTPAGKIKLGIVEEAHLLTEEAANALLKTLEEPPKKAVLLLFSKTTNLLPTIKSRCREIEISGGESNIKMSPELKAILKEPFHRRSKYIEEKIKIKEIEGIILELLAEASSNIKGKADIEGVLAAKEIFRAKRLIEGNANARLVLENLFLKLSK
jgi:DNA polymerase III delta prime subunit